MQLRFKPQRLSLCALVGILADFQNAYEVAAKPGDMISLMQSHAALLERDHHSQSTEGRVEGNRVVNASLQMVTVRDLYPDMTAPRVRQQMSVSYDVDQHLHSVAFDTSTLSAQRKCGILWFYHVPKCCGTAIGEWLGRLHDAGLIDSVLPLMSMDHLVDYKQFKKDNLDPVLDDPGDKLIAVHHHHRGPGLYNFDSEFDDMHKRLQAHGCHLMRATFLREPEEYVTSALYFNTPWQSSPAAYRQEFKKVMDGALAPELHNGELRYILNNKMWEYDKAPFDFSSNGISDSTWKEAVSATNAVLAKFDVVGITEQSQAGALQIAQLLGMPDALSKVPLSQVNVNGHQKLPSGSDLHNKVLTNTKYDILVYKKWAASAGGK